MSEKILSVLKSWRSAPMAVYDLAWIHRWCCNSEQRILRLLWRDDFQLHSQSLTAPGHFTLTGESPRFTQGLWLHDGTW